MKTLSLFAALFIASSATAQTNVSLSEPKLVICSNLLAAKTITELEVESYRVRGYDAVTSVYMRLALNKVQTLLTNARSQGDLESSDFAASISEGIRYEIVDTYRYEAYRLSTAGRIFSKLNADIASIQRTNNCAQ